MIGNRFIVQISVIFTLVFLLGCSGGPDPVCVDPGLSGADRADISSRSLWGLWHCRMDPGSGQIEVAPMRSAMFTANVNNLLEANPGNLLIEDMDATDFFTEGRLDCTITLKHPFTGLDMYHGFDVWGVFMHNANISLNYDLLAYSADPDAGENVAVLHNPDGWTRWFNYIEFNGSSVPILEYWPGALSNLPAPTATLNPFKIFADGLGEEEDYYTWITASGNVDDRGIFRAGELNSRRYELEFPIIDSSPVAEFQYAVIATWEPGDPALTGQPDIFDPGDFPVHANCEEAFFVTVSTIGSDLYYAASDDLGGTFRADIEVFDWQGGSVGGLGVLNEIERIIIEGEFIPEGDASHEISQAELVGLALPATENSSVFQVEIVDCIPQESGDAGFWVIVEAAGANGESYDQGFPTEYPDPARRAAFLPGSVTVNDESPIVPLEGWLCFGHDVRHTGVADCVLDPSMLEFKWTYPTGDKIESSPVISGGTVYFGSYDGNVYAVDLLSGIEDWIQPLDSAVCGTAAIGQDEIYIGTHGGTEGYFYALSRIDGSVVWTYVFDEESISQYDFVVNGAILVNEWVYFTANNGYIYCVDASDGSEIFVEPTFTLGNSLSTTPAYYEELNQLIVTSGSDIVSFDADDGTEIWREEPVAGSFISCSPTLEDGMVYFTSQDALHEDYVWKYDISGLSPVLVWSEELINPDPWWITASGALDDNHYYSLSDSQGKVYACNKDTGDFDWKAPPSNVFGFSSSPAISGDTIYCASTETVNDTLYGFNTTTGAEVFNYTLGDYPESSVAIDDDYLLVGCSDGNMYCFGPPD